MRKKIGINGTLAYSRIIEEDNTSFASHQIDTDEERPAE
jgi:hypothetical protein